MAKCPRRQKKSDVGKADDWLSPRLGTARALKLEYHLILTEGEQTEPHYFKAMKKAIECKLGKDDRGQISIKVEDKGIPIQDMFREAEIYLRAHANKPISHVWFVYDKDQVDDQRFDQMVRDCAVRSACGDITYHAIWSNECFELWLLLHFIPLEAAIPREQYRDKLSEYLGRKYRKNDAALFPTLLPHLDDALKNARMLRGRYSGEDYHAMAPCTTMYELLEWFLSYIR